MNTVVFPSCRCVQAAWAKIKPGDEAQVSIRSEVIASLMELQTSKGLEGLSKEEREKSLLKKLDALLDKWRKNPVTSAFADYFDKEYRKTIGLWCHAFLGENLAGHWTNNLLERYHGEWTLVSTTHPSPLPPPRPLLTADHHLVHVGHSAGALKSLMGGSTNTRIDALLTGLSDMFDNICLKQQSKLYGGRRDHKTQALHSKLTAGAQRLPWSKFTRLSDNCFRYTSVKSGTVAVKAKGNGEAVKAKGKGEAVKAANGEGEAAKGKWEGVKAAKGKGEAEKAAKGKAKGKGEAVKAAKGKGEAEKVAKGKAKGKVEAVKAKGKGKAAENAKAKAKEVYSDTDNEGDGRQEDPIHTTCDVTVLPEASRAFMGQLSALGTCNVAQSGSPCIHAMKVLLHEGLFDLESLEPRITIRRPTVTPQAIPNHNPTDDVFFDFYPTEDGSPPVVCHPCSYATNDPPPPEEPMATVEDMDVDIESLDGNGVDEVPTATQRRPCFSRPVTEAEMHESIKRSKGWLTALLALCDDIENPLSSHSARILESNLHNAFNHVQTSRRNQGVPLKSGPIPTIHVNGAKFKRDNAVANRHHHQGKSGRAKDMIDKAKDHNRKRAASSTDLGRNKKVAKKVNPNRPKSYADVRELQTRSKVQSKEVDAISDLIGTRRLQFNRTYGTCKHGHSLRSEYEVREKETGIIRWAKEADLLGAADVARKKVDTEYTRRAWKGAKPLQLLMLTWGKKGHSKYVGHTFSLTYGEGKEKDSAQCVVVEHHKFREYPFTVVFRDEEVMAVNYQVLASAVAGGD